MIRTSNPMLNESIFQPSRSRDAAFTANRTMTLQGAVNASLILLGLCCAAAVSVWTFLQPVGGGLHPLMFPVAFGGSILALILCVVCHFKPAASPYLAWIIALGEGCLAGGLSLFWSAYVQRKTGLVGELGTGLVLQASLLTGGIAVSLLIAYKTRLIRATENFKLAIVAATAGICLVSLASMLLGMFGVRIPYLWDNGIIGIGFAGFVVVIAALNLVLDFDFIERGSENGLPRYMEWYAGIGLLVTLVWLYVSLLRLLAMLQDRR